MAKSNKAEKVQALDATAENWAWVERQRELAYALDSPSDAQIRAAIEQAEAGA